MEVLHPTALLAEPNKCIICDETPHPWETRVVDTEYTMVAPFSDNVWHKYICEKCGLEIANRLGYISNEQAKAAFHAAEAAADRLDSVREKVLSAAEEIHAFATDVSLGTERSKVGKTVAGDFAPEEGEFVDEAKASEVPPSKPKAPASRKKAPVGSGASAGSA